MPPPTVYTIGHSNHAIDQFLAVLRGAEITAVADVRSTPYSRYLEHFNREELQASLRAARIAYVYLGDRLGGRPSNPSCYREGVADYERVAATPVFTEGISRVIRGAEKYRIALMCSEKDPLDCHRFLLVSRALKGAGVDVTHIRSDGSLDPMAATERRLMETTGQVQTQLFGTATTDPLTAAYRARAAEVAYREVADDDDTSPQPESE